MSISDNSENHTYYLYIGEWCRTMSPENFYLSNQIRGINVDDDGKLGNHFGNSEGGVQVLELCC